MVSFTRRRYDLTVRQLFKSSAHRRTDRVRAMPKTTKISRSGLKFIVVGRGRVSDFHSGHTLRPISS
jgi:hypothetical protein